MCWAFRATSWTPINWRSASAACLSDWAIKDDMDKLYMSTTSSQDNRQSLAVTFKVAETTWLGTEPPPYRTIVLLPLIYFKAIAWLVSFAAVIRVVKQCSSPTNGCSLELCIPFPLSLRTSNMHVTVSRCTNHISCYICRQRSRFPRNGSLLLIGQFKERNAELEWAAVSWGGTLRDDPSNGCEGDYRLIS